MMEIRLFFTTYCKIGYDRPPDIREGVKKLLFTEMSVNGLTPPPRFTAISEKVGVFLGGKVRGVIKNCFLLRFRAFCVFYKTHLLFSKKLTDWG